MISPFDMYFASTPVIAMRSTGCLRFPECPRAGGAGRMIFFKGQKAVLWTRANRDVPDQDFSDLRPNVQDAEFRRSMKPGLALQPAPTTGEHPAVHAPNKRDQLLHRIGTKRT